MSFRVARRIEIERAIVERLVSDALFSMATPSATAMARL
jgi:hypothetical protein